ncbi:site-specific integrase [Streptomyces sp. NBC_00048]|uniref:site-specific integrase n=1 Tax=Streptomyces sp. NBC_00048 TaxID=2975628 RepID=UPI00324B8A1E
MYAFTAAAPGGRSERDHRTGDRSPLFLTGRRAPAGIATLDVCEETGRARLSYRRAEEIFEEHTRLLANPLASPEGIEHLDGWTLHRLRRSALRHDAEEGTSTRMLLARSRRASVRSLERYARPGVDSVARHVAERDPAARHNGSASGTYRRVVWALVSEPGPLDRDPGLVGA